MKKCIVTIGLILCVLVIPANAKILRLGDFETGDLSQWNTKLLCFDHSAKIVEDNVRAGKYAVRLETRIEDPDCFKHRAMLLWDGSVVGGFNAERWYGFSIFIPSSDIDDDYHEGWAGFNHQYQSCNSASSPFNVRRNHDKTYFVVRYDKRTCAEVNAKVTGKSSDYENMYEMTTIKGRWVDWVIHAKYSIEEDGIIEIWRDGQKVATHKGPNYYLNPGTSSAEFKLGPYKWAWSNNPVPSGHNADVRVMYVDEVRMGDANSNYNEVAPGGTVPAPFCGDGACSAGETCVQDKCCKGKAYSTSTQGCCNGIIYSLSNQVCCSGAVHAGDCCSGNDCSASDTCESYKCVSPAAECSNGIDDDGDGKKDYPADSGCVSAADDDESNCGDGSCEGTEQCSLCVDCGECPGKCDNIQAIYHLDGNVQDSANANHGTVNGATLVSSLDGFGQAYSFDGEDDNINIGDRQLVANDMTISLWVRPDTLHQGYLVSKYSSNGQEYAVYFDGPGNDYRLIVGNADGTSFSGADVSNSLSADFPVGDWTNLFVTRSRSDVHFYVDGVEKTVVPAVAGSVGTNDFADTDSSLMIGDRSDGGRAFDGSIDEVAIWNRALASQEIVQIVDSGIPINCGCSSGADSSGDSIVSLSELIDFFGEWKAGRVTISQLLVGIGEWKDGCV